MSKQVKVLHIGMTPNFGGLESYVMSMYRHIDREKIQFDFIDWYGKNNIAYTNEIKKLGGKIFKIPSRRESIISNSKIMKEIINKGNYQYIYYNLNSLSYVVGMKYILNSTNKEIIVHSHNDNIEFKKILTILFDKMHKHLMKKDVIRLACSENAGKWMFGKNDFTCIPNSIDVDKFEYNSSIRDKYRKQMKMGSKIVYGNVARFAPQKNHTFLIDIFHKIYLQNPNSMLILVGDGNLKLKIQEKVNQMGIADAVKFMGMRNDIPELMQAMDIMIAPSIFEGFGISALEAQCSGLKCYVSDVFNDEVVQTPNIKKIPLSIPSEKWAEKILGDEANERNYSRRSYKQEIISKGYDINTLVNKMEALFVDHCI